MDIIKSSFLIQLNFQFGNEKDLMLPLIHSALASLITIHVIIVVVSTGKSSEEIYLPVRVVGLIFIFGSTSNYATMYQFRNVDNIKFELINF